MVSERLRFLLRNRRCRQNKKTSKGFTIIEILVVCVIISILTALAFPNILRSRIISYETMAIANLKTVINSCQIYYNNNNTYPDSLSDLIEPNSTPPYIDSQLASGSKQGYNFLYVTLDAQHFSVNANPVSPGLTGEKYFFMNETGVIRANTQQAAGPSDPIYSP